MSEDTNGVVFLFRWLELGDWEDTTLDIFPAWVRVYGAPFKMATKNKVRTLAKMVGNVISLQMENPNKLRMSKFIRVQVEVDMTKGLSTRRFVTL